MIFLCKNNVNVNSPKNIKNKNKKIVKNRKVEK